MSDLVTYERVGPAARLTMGDGKVNAMSPAMLGALHAAFDRAAEEQAIVVLSSRERLFSAGFDLKLLRGGEAAEIRSMLRLGAEIALKILSFPCPVITATAGHAYPMGAFLMLGADWRIGTDGDWRVGLNEVRIGLSLPGWAVETARARLSPIYFNRTVLGDMVGPEEAKVAGFLDEVVPAPELNAAVDRAVEHMAGIDLAAHAATKARVRGSAIAAIKAAIAEDFDDLDTDEWMRRRG